MAENGSEVFFIMDGWCRLCEDRETVWRLGWSACMCMGVCTCVVEMDRSAELDE